MNFKVTQSFTQVNSNAKTNASLINKGSIQFIYLTTSLMQCTQQVILTNTHWSLLDKLFMFVNDKTNYHLLQIILK